MQSLIRQKYRVACRFFEFLKSYKLSFESIESFQGISVENTKEYAQKPRVDLHRPKTLIIQFHTISQSKNAKYTNFMHFCQMSLIEF